MPLTYGADHDVPERYNAPSGLDRTKSRLS